MPNDDSILTIRWSTEDFKSVLLANQKEATDEQVQALIALAARDLEDRSIERGWEILEFYAAEIEDSAERKLA